MAREKQQDKGSANQKPSTQSGGKSMSNAPDGGKNKGKSGKDSVDPMKKE